MKIVSHYLQEIEGVAIYPIISLLIFFTFFVAVFIWVMKISKADIKTLSNLPLEDEMNEANNQEN
jgi:cytochrome c oxidase cbb3-type subunit IV